LLVRIVEVSGREPNRDFLNKLEGIGFGFLIPVFFISTGVAFQLRGLLAHPAALALVPFFLLALLVVRGVPALLYVRTVGRRRAAAGGLLQATTLTFVIVATEIGVEDGKLTPAAAAALVAAGLLSAAVFPAAAARLLSRGRDGERRAEHARVAAAAPAGGSPAEPAEPASEDREIVPRQGGPSGRSGAANAGLRDDDAVRREVRD
jgi:Kef-type K+ transport system membrane component KefB